MRLSRFNPWLLVLSSAVLQALIFPSPALAFLSWVAFVPLLYALLRSETSVGRGFLLGYVCGILWYAATCFWIFHTMHVYGGLGSAAAAGVLVLFCMYLGLYHGAFAALLAYIARRWSRKAALWVSPVLWVAVEFARYQITGFPWDLLGTAVVDNVTVTRLAAFTGVYGISSLSFAVNAIVCFGLLEKRKQLWVAGLAAALGLQALKHIEATPSAPTHTATLVQQNLPLLHSWDAVYFDRQMFELTNLSRENVKKDSLRPRLIVWPESPAPFYTADQKFRTWLQALATDTRSYVIAGSLGVSGAGESRQIFNSAVLVAPSGEFVARYDKIHLVPFGEYVPFERLLAFAGSLVQEVGRFARGNQRNTLDIEGHKAGVFICYESVFPDEVRQFVANGAEVLVNISDDDWYGEYNAPGQHLNMARMRAIENHRWILRATNSGITAAIDPYGRVVAQAKHGVRAALSAPYAFETNTTFYTRHGDWFPWSCAIISIVTLGFVRLRARS